MPGQILGCLGAALLLCACAGPGGTRIGGGGRISKCLKIGMVQVEGTLEERFALLKRLGFDGVEMDSPASVDRDEVVAAARTTGLAIPGVVCSTHWGHPLSDPDPAVRARGLAGLVTAIEDCAAYGGSTVLLVPAVVNDKVSYGDAWTRSITEIKKVLPRAEELGVRIAFENVWNDFITDPNEAVRYVDAFDSPWVGWYFDIGNIVYYGEPADWIRTLGSRIIKLDIKDYSREKMEADGRWAGFGVQIGEGSANWPAVMAELSSLGYRSWGSAEVGGGGEERLRQISENMDRVFRL